MNTFTLQQVQKEHGQTLTELLICLLILILFGAALFKMGFDWVREHPQLSAFAFGFLLALVPMWAVAGKDNDAAKGLGVLLMLGLIVVLVIGHQSKPVNGGDRASDPQSPPPVAAKPTQTTLPTSR